MDDYDARPRHGRTAVHYARVVHRCRWLVVALWIGGAFAATVWLPSLQTAGGSDLGGLVPAHSQAIATEKQVLHDFAFPMQSNTVVVAHDDQGLAPLTQLDVVLWALHYDQRLQHLQRPYPSDTLLGALPVLNTAGLFPTAHRPGTTAITYLFFAPSTSLATRTKLAQQYAHHFATDPGVTTAVTGTVPARVEQSNLLQGHLQEVEIATLVLVTLIVAVTFRSVIAPVVLLAAALLSYLVGVRVLGFVGGVTDVSLPTALEPLVVALVLGILTDYSVFFLTGMRRRLRAGADLQGAFRMSLRDNIPIVAVAGLTVAAGTGSLYVSQLQMFRAFGPGLAISVLVGAASAVTFVPAAMAILGRRVYWPSHPERHGEHRTVATGETGETGETGDTGGASDTGGAGGADTAGKPSWPVRFISRRSGAAIAGVLTIGGLLAAASPLLHVRLDTSFISALPSDQPASEGARLVQQGFAYGVLAPVTALVRSPDVRGDATGNSTGAAELGKLQSLIADQPGVAGVLGPGSVPLPGAHGVFVSQQQPEARYLVFLDGTPLGGTGVAEFRHLRAAVPALLDRAGLASAHASLTGDPAIAAVAAGETVHNLELVFAAAFAVEFVILALFLRALLAPLLLLGASALVVASALGLATWVFQGQLHTDGLTFYAPFATSVLLIALGSDYNVFGAGRIWEEAAEHPLRRAIRRALPSSSKAITTAGLTLASSFALVALVPLRSFHEMAFTMFAGLLIDTFIVRSILTPALLTLAGPAAGWPGRRLREPADRDDTSTRDAAPEPVPATGEER